MDTNTNGATAPWSGTEAGKQVMARFSEEHTLNAIDHLLARIDTLDKAVENLTTLMRQGPGLVAMKVDMLDEAYRDADAKGVNIDERLKSALAIAEKLTAPAMLEKLDGMLKLADQMPGLVAMKIDTLDEAYRQADAKGINIDERLGAALKIAEKLTAPAMLEKLDGMLKLADQMPGLVAMKVDMLDEAYKEADAKGINIDERLGAALQMAEKLTAPAMLKRLDGMLTLTDQMPGLVAMKIDMLDEAYRDAGARGINIDERLGAALQMMEKLTAPEMMEKLDGMLKLTDQVPGLIAMTADMVDERMKDINDSGFDPKALMEVAGSANTALTNARAEPPTKVGLFGMLKVLKDPDRQKGLGFLMNFLKHFGRNI